MNEYFWIFWMNIFLTEIVRSKTLKIQIPCSMYLRLIQWIDPLVHLGKTEKTTEKRRILLFILQKYFKYFQILWKAGGEKFFCHFPLRCRNTFPLYLNSLYLSWNPIFTRIHSENSIQWKALVRNHNWILTYRRQ